MIQGTSIVEIIEERIDQGGIDLPVFPRIALELQRLSNKGDFGATEVVRIIRKDQSLASQVLKMSNSSFYQGLKPATTIQDAVIRLGIKSIITLVVTASQNQLYRSHIKEYQRLMSLLWRHALGVAVGSRWLALHLGLDRLSEESFLAGLLHDIGKLLLLKILEELQGSGKITEDIPGNLLDDILVGMHCKEGGRLMRDLHLPEIYCEVAAKHHDSGNEQLENLVLSVVRLSNLACRKLGIDLAKEPGLMLSTTPEAVGLMASDMMLAEMQVKLEAYARSFEKANETYPGEGRGAGIQISSSSTLK